MTVLHESRMEARRLDDAERRAIEEMYSAPLSGFREESEGVALEDLGAALERGEVERTPERAQCVAAARLLALLREATEVLGTPGTGVTLLDDAEWLLNSGTGTVADLAGLTVMTAAQQVERRGSDVKWRQVNWYYRAWMLDTGYPIFVYDNFSGPACRWEFSAGEVARSLLLEKKDEPRATAVVHEVALTAEERRLL